MRTFRSAMLFSLMALAQLMPAADHGLQLLVGQEQGVKSELRDATGTLRGLWLQGSLQTAVQGTSAPTWLDLGVRLHSGKETDVRVFSLCWTDRSPVMGGLGFVLGGGLAGGFVDTATESRDGWSPMIQAGLNYDSGTGVVVEGLYQYLPRDIGDINCTAWAVGIGLRF